MGCKDKVAVGEGDQLGASSAGVGIPRSFCLQSEHLQMCKSGFYRGTGHLSNPFIFLLLLIIALDILRWAGFLYDAGCHACCKEEGELNFCRFCK